MLVHPVFCNANSCVERILTSVYSQGQLNRGNTREAGCRHGTIKAPGEAFHTDQVSSGQRSQPGSCSVAIAFVGSAFLRPHQLRRPLRTTAHPLSHGLFIPERQLDAPHASGTIIDDNEKQQRRRQPSNLPTFPPPCRPIFTTSREGQGDKDNTNLPL